MHIGNMKLWLGLGIAVAVAFVVLLASAPSSPTFAGGDPAQPGCGGGTPPQPDEADLTKITNLVPDDKKLDLAIVGAWPDNGYHAIANKIVTKLIGKGDLNGPVAKVLTLQDAIAAINAAYTGNGSNPLNVLIADHAAPGKQNIGQDIISNQIIDEPVPPDIATTQIDNKAKFVAAVAGKIKTLKFVSCSVADEAKGQTFIEKLQDELGADKVSGFTGTVWAYPNNCNLQTLKCNNFYVENGFKKNVDNTGSTAGVSDLIVTLPGFDPINTNIGLFYCISKTDHAPDDALTVYLQCNIDVADGGVAPNPDVPPTWNDTCEELADRDPPQCIVGEGSSNGQLNNPSETGADAIAGPPPPPPYTSLAPSVGRGTYYAADASPADVCGSVDCTIVTSCFEDTGPATSGTGPNIISTATILDPNSTATVMADTTGDTNKDTQVDRVSNGTVSIWYNQNNENCTNLTPKGDANFEDYVIQSIQVNDKGGTNVNPNPVPWRPGPKPGATTIDFDGDGCTDEQELDPKAIGKCGDDPQNPSDSFANANDVDLSGVYDLLVTARRGDCLTDQCVENDPGAYFFCRADIQHDPSDNSIVVRPFCYTDSALLDINVEAYPGIKGDGMAGGPPPGPQYSALCPDTANDGAGCVLDNESGLFAYADVDEAHPELTGTFNKQDNTFEVAGCFPDLDGQGSIGDVYVELSLSAHQLPGTVDIWILQDVTECENGRPFGTYVDFNGEPIVFLGINFNDAPIRSWQPNPNKGKGYDQDDDGVPTARELGDDPGCGRRDPYNKNDYYDVSIPRDGVIDLANDILGTIVRFAPGGYAPGDENWDRPPAMVGRGAGSNWNRGSPDGVIDLANDILGVILQFNPGGCPPNS